MKRWFALAVLALFSHAYGEEWRPADFAYGLPLANPGNAAWYEVTLPFSVYSKAQRGDLGDIRVFNSEGQVVPHAFVPIPSERNEKRPPVALGYFPLRGQTHDIDRVAIRIQRNGTIVDVGEGRTHPDAPRIAYVLDATGYHGALQALLLEWRNEAEGFSGSVRVEASDDLRSWRTLADAAPLLALDYGGQKLEQKRVAFPAQEVKYLRLTWPAKQKPIALTAVRAEPADGRAATPRTWQGTTAIAGKASGEYEFDLGGAPPVDRLRLELPQANTLISGQVYTRGRVEDPWRPVYSGVFYRLFQDGQTVASPDVEIYPASARYWLLRVDMRSGGLGDARQLPTLQAGWIPARLLFVARGNGPFELAYGNPRVERNGLTIASIVPGYDPAREQRYAQATAGEARALGGDARLGVPIDWKTWTLWAILVAGVAGLGAMAWRLLRQMPKEG